MNGLGVNERTTYVRLADGKFLVPNPSGKIERTNPSTGVKSYFDGYDYIQGKLQRVELRDGDFGKQYLFWFDTGITLAMKQDNMTTQALINSLASMQANEVIKVSTWLNKKGRAAIYVTANGEQLKWAHDWDTQPKAEKILNKSGKPVLNSAGKETYDTEERVAFFDTLVTTINAQLQNAKPSPVESTGEQVDW